MTEEMTKTKARTRTTTTRTITITRTTSATVTMSLIMTRRTTRTSAGKGKDTGTRHGQSFIGLCRNIYVVLHDETLLVLWEKSHADLSLLDEVFAVQNYNTFQLQFSFQFLKAKGFFSKR